MRKVYFVKIRHDWYLYIFILVFNLDENYPDATSPWFLSFNVDVLGSKTGDFAVKLLPQIVRPRTTI